MWCILLCGMCLAAQPSTDHSTSRIPWGVRGELLVSAPNAPEVAVAKCRFEISRDWVRCDRWFSNGSLGWTFQDFTFDTAKELIGFDGPTRRGVRARMLADRGISRTDPEMSPICWVRIIEAQKAAGVRVEESRIGETLVLTLPSPERLFTIEATIDRGELARVVRTDDASKERRSEWRYLDWREFPDGTRHPWRIEADHTLPGPSVAKELNLIQKLEPIGPGTAPSPYELPADIVIVDYIDNVQRDGRMNITGRIDPPSTQRAVSAASGAQTRGWLVGGGMASLLGAAVVWNIRRRTGA